MKVVTENEAPKRALSYIDYDELARLYNQAQVKGGVELDRVYNITLFKRALTRWGLKEGEDFTAENRGKVTLVVRLSNTTMTKG